MSNLSTEMGTDAREWARSWLATLAEHPEIAADEQTMIGWFANAIMAGYDEGRRVVQRPVRESHTGSRDRSPLDGS